MIINCTYKLQQEEILIKAIVESSMISKNQLNDIKKCYHQNVAYHNFVHALTVASKVLETLSHKEFNIIEIKSLFIAALFHDA
jgi:hypothetical protein